MQSFVRALTTMIAAGPTRPNPSKYIGDLTDAPPEAVELVEALTTRQYHIALGEYDMWPPSAMNGELWDVADHARQALDLLGASLDEKYPDFDAAKTVLLTEDGGGTSSIAISWGRGRLEGLAISHDAGDEALFFFEESDQMLAWIGDLNERFGTTPKRAKNLPELIEAVAASSG